MSHANNASNYQVNYIPGCQNFLLPRGMRSLVLLAHFGICNKKLRIQEPNNNSVCVGML